MISTISASRIFATFAFLGMFLGFFCNAWNTSAPKWFRHFQRDSELLVIGGIYHQRTQPAWDIFGMGAYTLEPGNFWEHRTSVHNYACYKLNPPDEKACQQEDGFEKAPYEYYKSNIGFQAHIWYLIDGLLPFTAGYKIEIMHLLMAGMTATVFTLITVWCRYEFGLFPALFFMVLLIESQWFINLSRNYYTIFALYFLPLLTVATWMRRPESAWEKPCLFFTAVAASLWLRSVCGNEYITGAMVGAACPLIYAGLAHRWGLRRLTRGLALITSACVAGFAFSMAMQWILLIMTEGSAMKAFEHLAGVFLKRSHAVGFFHYDAFNADYINASLKVPTSAVIAQYLWGSFPFQGYAWFAFGNYIECIAVLFALIIFLRPAAPSLAATRQKLIRLSAVTVFSLIGPLSWFTIMKAHSYLHGHVNYIAWYLPFGVVANLFVAASLCWLGMVIWAWGKAQYQLRLSAL